MLMNCWTGGIGRRVSELGSFFQANASDSQVFPSFITHERGVTKLSALAKLKENRALKKQQNSGA